MNEKNGSPRVPPSDLVVFTSMAHMAKDGPYGKRWPLKQKEEQVLGFSASARSLANSE